MTAYRNTLLLLSGLLLAASAAAQPRLSAPDPAAYRQPDLNNRFDTRGDRHPHVEHGPNGSLVFRNERLVGELVRGQDGTYGPLYLYPASRPTQPWTAPVAVVEEFVTLDGTESTPGHFRPRSAEIHKDGDRLLLRGDVGEGSARWPVELTLAIDREPWLSWNVRVLGRAGGSLRNILPMQTRIGHEGPRTVLLPGITFSERTDSVGGYPVPRDITPDPTQITVPLVGAAQGDTTVALMWNPEQEWGGPGLPTVSARFSDRTADPAAIVSLYAPARSGGESTPVTVPAGKALSLSGKILVVRETENVASAVRHWDAAYNGRKTDVFGQDRDTAPKYLRSWEQSRVLARKAYAGRPAAAAATPTDEAERDLARDAEVQDVLVQMLDAGQEHAPHGGPVRSSVDAALNRLEERGPLDPRLAYRTGSVNRSLGALRERVQSLIRSQLVRGSWPLDRPSDQPDFTEDLRILPEKPVDVEVGTITQNALPVLQYGALTGDSDAIGSGIRALEYIDRLADRRPYGRFRVPAGAGVPYPRRQIATLYSATQAAECFLLGYQATGQLRYLDSARYWADTGLPFIYFWDDPHRPALRGASLSRFYAGLSEDVSNRPASQRVGLFYARMLQRLNHVRPDDFYDRVVRAITASALQQQPATGANAGMLPELWDVRENRPTGGWLTPGPLLGVQASLNRYNMDVSHVRVRTGSDRIFVASGAQIDRPTTSTMRLRLNLRWANGEESYTTVTGVAARPIRVEYNTEVLPVIRIPVARHYLREANEEFGPGWFYDDDTGLLTIRVRHTSGDDHLEVRWPDPRERSPVDRVDIRVRNNR